ncbi:MAG: DUF4886 domain-containing protein, partial [Oscillospiraceae bacterium]|nr:DUF4886 domain-containing protein [Oscillospiraceae bacterium]
MKKTIKMLLSTVLMLLLFLSTGIVATAEENSSPKEVPNPIPYEWPLLDADLSHIVCYGQSFSNGSDAPAYTDEIVDGVYVYGSITKSTTESTLLPLQLTSGTQHPIASACNVLGKLFADKNINTKIVAGSYGVGGKTIAQLMSSERQLQIKEEEGYSYDILSSGRYEVFQSSVSAIAQYAKETGQSAACPIIVYLQGETDQNTDAQLGYPENPIRAGYGAGGDKEKYKEYMRRLKEDMQNEVMKAYGQTEKPLFMIYQVSGTYVRTKYSSINMAQLEFAQENEDVILVQTPYFTSHYTNSHHLTVNGYRWLGEYIAKYAYSALVEREKMWPMLPEKISVESENQIRMEVNKAENGLSIDTYTVENATNSKNLYGFNLYIDNERFVPEKIEVSGKDIVITMPNNSPNLVLAESVYVQYGGQSANGTGNIRDNCSEKGFYEYLDDSNDIGTGNNQGVSHSARKADGTSLIGEKYPMYNWLASFCYDIKKEEIHVHEYSVKTIAPSCDKKGYTVYYCACGYNYTNNFTEATGIHEYYPIVTSPTCTEGGYTTYICTCGDIKEVTDYVSALGHREVMEPNILPTAEMEGFTEGSYCEVCRTVIKERKTIPAKGYGKILEDGAFKVLLIGNTFSEDAANYGQGIDGSQLLTILNKMVKDDVKVTVGLIHSGATSMAWHATQAERNGKTYNFRIIESETGRWKSNGAVASAEALQWTDWDAVVLQPFSTEAFTGKANPIHPEQEEEIFYPFESSTAYMLDHVNKHAPTAEIYCFMHWQRTKVNKMNISIGSHNSMAEFFPIVMEYRGTNSGARYSKIIPVGTAVQNARTTYLAMLGYNMESKISPVNDPQFGLQRDENHLSLNMGRYIAALTFAETIIPEEIHAEGYVLPDIRVTESVGKLPKEYTEIAQKSVFAAVENWKNGSLAVTEIAGYKEDPTVAAAEALAKEDFTVGQHTNAEEIKNAVLAKLPEDFAVDKVVIPEDTSLESGSEFECTATIRFGYTSVDVAVKCKIPAYKVGDINRDGKVNTIDANYARR